MADVILRGKQAAFVDAYMANELLPIGERQTLTQVAVIAGVHEKSATTYPTQALANPSVQAAIAERKRERAKQGAALADVDAIRVLREWAEIATADPTDVVTVRRVNCRHCWGVGHGYHYTENEYARETAEAIQDGADLSAFAGGPGYRYNRPPHPECPECAGEGVEDVYIHDLRKLKGPARRLIAGVRQGKHGVEVIFRDQDAALKNLAQYLGLLIERKEHSGPGGGPIATANVNYSLPSDPVEAARTYQLLMEGK